MARLNDYLHTLTESKKEMSNILTTPTRFTNRFISWPWFFLWGVLGGIVYALIFSEPYGFLWWFVGALAGNLFGSLVLGSGEARMLARKRQLRERQIIEQRCVFLPEDY